MRFCRRVVPASQLFGVFSCWPVESFCTFSGSFWNLDRGNVQFKICQCGYLVWVWKLACAKLAFFFLFFVCSWFAKSFRIKESFSLTVVIPDFLFLTFNKWNKILLVENLIFNFKYFQLFQIVYLTSAAGEILLDRNEDEKGCFCEHEAFHISFILISQQHHANKIWLLNNTHYFDNYNVNNMQFTCYSYTFSTL